MKKVIIVGGTSGIGRALAELYAGRGDQVAVTGRRNELLYSLQLSYPNNILTACFDVRDQDSLRHIDYLIDQLGGLDLLIYNAGYGEASENLNLEIDKATVDINVNGFLTIVNAVFNYFQRQGHGQIAATSSIASIRGNGKAPAYSASKAFMSAYMEGLYLKSRKQHLNIVITDILPGFVDTKMAKGNKRFWVAPVDKAAQQIFNAIEAGKWRVFVTKRWRFVAAAMKLMPSFVYHKIM